MDLKKKTKLKDKIKSFFDDVFSSSKKTIRYTFILLAVILNVYFLFILFFRDSFYNNYSDDSLQYYPFMVNFIKSIKDGSFSFYQAETYLGASFFSDTYYIPLDFFTLVIFVLSYIVPTEIAMSIVELLKMVLASIILMKYLERKGTKPKVLHIIGLMYFASSGMACYSAFPSFTSLSFYLPLSLIVIDSFINKKRWYFVPLFSMAVIFYNFYLAYTVFAFMAFAGIVIIVESKPKFFEFVLKEIYLVLLIVFGLLMSLSIFLPSFMYITKSTTRSVAADGSLSSVLLMFKYYLEILVEFFKSFINLFINIFKYKGSYDSEAFRVSFSTFNNLVIKLKDGIVVDGIKVKALFFNTEEYFRIMSTTYAPLTPSSFYGYQSSYFIEHMSMYVTGFALVMASYIFTMKDRVARIYRIMIAFMILFISLPVFSYIFSADLEVLYTRWINTLSLPILIVASYVLNENGLEGFKFKKIIMPLLMVVFFGLFSASHHLDKLVEVADKNNFSEEVITFEKDIYKYTVIIFVLISALLVAIYKLKTSKKESINKLLSIILLIFVSVFIAVDVVLIVISFVNANIGEWNTSFISKPLYSYTNQIALQYLTILTLILIVLEVFAIFMKKHKLLYFLIGIEVVLGSAMSLGIPVVCSGKETDFKNARKLSDYLDLHISDDELYRVYVDPSLGLIETNLYAYLGVSCNSNIFHSFINKETDGVVELLFNNSDEGQAGKKLLNDYSYYLAIDLGYKYLVTSKNTSTSIYDSDIYKVISSEDDPYLLLEFNDYNAFVAYDSYVYKNTFTSNYSSLKSYTKEFLLLYDAVINNEDENIIDHYFNEETEVEKQTNIVSNEKAINQKIDNILGELAIIEGVNYYKYDLSLLNINTRSYAINVFNSSIKTYVNEDKCYVALNNGNKPKIELNSMNGSDIHIPVYGDNSDNTKPNSLYIKAEGLSKAPNLSFTVEAIFPNNSDIYNYNNGEDLSKGVGLCAYSRYTFDINPATVLGNIKIRITDTYKNDLKHGSIFAYYEDGTIENISSEFSYTKKIKYIYVEKTSEMTELSVPPRIYYATYDVYRFNSLSSINNVYTSKQVTYKNNLLNVSYTKEANDGYNILVVPTSYSSEFEVISGDVKEVISVNGGFIGLIVDANITSNEIVLRFNPRGLELGTSISIVAIILYLYILNEYFYKKRRNVKWKL